MPGRTLTFDELGQMLEELAQVSGKRAAIGVTDTDAARYARALEYGSIAGSPPWPHPGPRTVLAVDPETGVQVVVSAQAPQGFIRVRIPQFVESLRQQLSQPADWLDAGAVASHIEKAVLGVAGTAAVEARPASSSYLREMEFTGDLRRKDFSGQDLTGALFREANLCRASFAGARLEDAFFLDCFAAEASFEGADCARLHATRTNFYRANLRGSILREALLYQCVLASADLRGAELRQLTVTLGCDSFEEVQLDKAAGAELLYLLTRAQAPQRSRWLAMLGEHDLARFEQVFAR